MTLTIYHRDIVLSRAVRTSQQTDLRTQLLPVLRANVNASRVTFYAGGRRDSKRATRSQLSPVLHLGHKAGICYCTEIVYPAFSCLLVRLFGWVMPVLVFRLVSCPGQMARLLLWFFVFCFDFSLILQWNRAAQDGDRIVDWSWG